MQNSCRGQGQTLSLPDATIAACNGCGMAVDFG